MTLAEQVAKRVGEDPEIIILKMPDKMPDVSPHPLIAAADVQNGAMIAFVPHVEDVLELAQEDGEELNQLHTTVFYLGDAEDFDVDHRMDLHDAIAGIASRQPPIVGDVFGFSIWNPSSDEPCLVADVGGSDLEDAYESVADLLADMEDDLPTIPEQHDPWRPHITLKYGVTQIPGELLDKTGSVTFDRIRLASTWAWRKRSGSRTNAIR